MLERCLDPVGNIGVAAYKGTNGDGAVVTRRYTSLLAKIIEADTEGSLILMNAQIGPCTFSDSGQLTSVDTGAYNRNQ